MKMYYYPVKIKQCISVLVYDKEWIKSVLPQSSWMYEVNCFDDGKWMGIDLLIPLLEMP